ncbi:MAG TPA: DUF6064 family protein [Thermoanaerobaculia bacterium]|nr:DUF6064 family protein [Thermoanaerobaculia bacterium]
MPFTRTEFFEVFRSYNEGIWPMQFVLVACGLATAALVFSRRQRAAALLLAFLFAWSAVAYHWTYFTRINPAAWLFGGVFLAGAVAFTAHSNRIRFGDAGPARLALGAVWMSYALVIYPIIAAALGHRYPAVPTFGAPCPVTILAMGALITAPRHTAFVPALVPVLWAVIASTAAFRFGVLEDLGLLGAVVTLVGVTIAERVKLNFRT